MASFVPRNSVAQQYNISKRFNKRNVGQNGRMTRDHVGGRAGGEGGERERGRQSHHLGLVESVLLTDRFIVRFDAISRENYERVQWKHSV